MEQNFDAQKIRVTFYESFKFNVITGHRVHPEVHEDPNLGVIVPAGQGPKKISRLNFSLQTNLINFLKSLTTISLSMELFAQ